MNSISKERLLLTTILIASAAVASIGCVGEEDTDATLAHPFSSELEAVLVRAATEIGGSESTSHTLPVCAHAAWATSGGGVFAVTDLVGVAEQTTEGVRAYTYVVMEPVEVWHGSLDGEVVVRIPGGPTGEDSFTGTMLELSVGQSVAMLLRAGTERFNEGFDFALPFATYYADGDGWLVNGATLSGDELRGAVVAAYGSFLPDEFDSDDCGLEIDYGRCPAESMVPPGYVAFDNPCNEAERREGESEVREPGADVGTME